jgi:alpha-L-fucosidase
MRLIKITFVAFIFGLICHLTYSQDPQNLAKPSSVQYVWHEQERIMFVCMDPCTWQGREYDDHSTPLERINPKALNTDQWCETATLWGAKEILFVAKHTGGFCWWQTETTDYGIKNTPYKDGKGDVLKELSASCEKYGLNLGIYVYPGDDTWGAGVGSGGRTRDPAKQEAYNKVFRQQLTETLSNYGDVMEVWFDGSCVIDVSDILEKHARNSVIFQGPHATLRWPGTESGILFYPVWNTVKSEDFNTGVSTQVHDDPYGDIWAPLETNTTLYDHFWFWAPEKMGKRKSLDQLMECYYKSVGYGSVFLLNSTPDTTGLIPEEDRQLYKVFGKEIDRRFGSPIAEVYDTKGKELILDLAGQQRINHIVTMEDYRQGQCIRAYTFEGYNKGKWIKLCQGQSVGRKKIDYFPEIEVSKVRLTIDKAVGEPLIRSMSVHYVKDFVAFPKRSVSVWSEWQNLQEWNFNREEKLIIEIDLSGRIKLPGQYSLQIIPEKSNAEIKISNVELYYNGNPALDKFVTLDENTININRTDQVTVESEITVKFKMECSESGKGNINFKPGLIY